MGKTKKADLFLWAGSRALYLWDSRRRQDSRIPLAAKDRPPYVPAFYDVWEDQRYYQSAMRKLLRGSIPVWKPSVLLALPEDSGFIERRALEDFLILSGARRVSVCLQSAVLRPQGETYLALTATCRCCCAALVRDGNVVEKVLVDIWQQGQDVLTRQLDRLRSHVPDQTLEVYYPQMEESGLLHALGTPVPFLSIADFKW